MSRLWLLHLFYLWHITMMKSRSRWLGWKCNLIRNCNMRNNNKTTLNYRACLSIIWMEYMIFSCWVNKRDNQRESYHAHTDIVQHSSWQPLYTDQLWESKQWFNLSPFFAFHHNFMDTKKEDLHKSITTSSVRNQAWVQYLIVIKAKMLLG